MDCITFIEVTDLYTKSKMLIRADLIFKVTEEVLNNISCSKIQYTNGKLDYVFETLEELVKLMEGDA